MPRITDWLSGLWTPNYKRRLERVIERERHHLLDFEEALENNKAAITATRARLKRLQKELNHHVPRNQDRRS